MNNKTCSEFNVIDEFKELTIEEINKRLRKAAFPYAVLMQHIQGDFNIGTMIRNANAFNSEKVFYLGKKKYDRRGTVGTHHYSDLKYIRELDSLRELKNEYCFIGIDNIEGSQSIYDFPWDKYEIATKQNQPGYRKALFLFGEENNGLIPEVLEMCQVVVHIPQYGSVRSLNVGTASGIIMNEFVRKCASI